MIKNFDRTNDSIAIVVKRLNHNRNYIGKPYARGAKAICPKTDTSMVVMKYTKNNSRNGFGNFWR